MKKIFEIIGLISLICFSFFYTNEISMVIKENDDIMIQIKEIKDQYKIEAIDALIEGNTIIPGVNGSEIDINKSYRKMKKIDSFNTNLLVYKDIQPRLSIKNIYNKYVISGNKSINNVALVFLLNDNVDINSLLKNLEEYEVSASFFVDEYWFENNNELVINLIELDYTVGLNLNNYDNSNFGWMNSIIKKIGKQEKGYCYNIIDNEQNLNRCSESLNYTIRPSIVIKANPLTEIKQQIKNGSIISLEINDKTIKQLPLIIEYINSKDLNIVNIEKLLEE